MKVKKKPKTYRNTNNSYENKKQTKTHFPNKEK